MSEPTESANPAERPDEQPDRPDDQAAQILPPDAPADDPSEPGSEVEERGPAVEEPAKVMRIGAMVKRLLDEVREAPLDEEARARLASIHERSLHELEDGLSPDLVEELHRMTLPFADDRTPTEPELRIAQAQLVGWLEGLFHGLQTALVAQQLAAQQQLSQMRHLPPGLLPPQADGHPDAGDGRPSPGQYL